MGNNMLSWCESRYQDPKDDSEPMFNMSSKKIAKNAPIIKAEKVS